MQLAVGNKALVRPDAATVYSGTSWVDSMNPFANRIVTIKYTAPNGNVYHIKEDPDGFYFDYNHFLDVPYDQDNFNLEWLRPGDVLTLVDGTIYHLDSDSLVSTICDIYTPNAEALIESTDRDIYKITREDFTLFKRTL